MASVTKVKFTGLSETLEVFQQLADEIGDKKANSKVLIPAVKEALKPVLALAKSMAPHNKGTLQASLVIVARKPTSNDKKSRYITRTDTVIGLVTTKNIPRKLRKELAQATVGLKGKEYKQAKRKFYAGEDTLYDARAIAQEFGTAKMPAHPFLRSSLESQKETVVMALGSILKNKIEQYRSKNIKWVN